MFKKINVNIALTIKTTEKPVILIPKDRNIRVSRHFISMKHPPHPVANRFSSG